MARASRCEMRNWGVAAKKGGACFRQGCMPSTVKFPLHPYGTSARSRKTRAEVPAGGSSAQFTAPCAGVYRAVHAIVPPKYRYRECRLQVQWMPYVRRTGDAAQDVL